MGKAIIVKGLDFSASGLGKVTIFRPMPLEALSIVGVDSVVGTEDAYTFDVQYDPVATTQRGVSWSIVEGEAYATIDNNGNLSILSGARASLVTIRATSLFNENIHADKVISVTYKASEPIHTGSTYFIPLTRDSAPTQGTLNVVKENATYSEEGALIDALGEGICYEIPSGVIIKAIAFDFYKHNYGLAMVTISSIRELMRTLRGTMA